jgi:uncharacterized protein with WD repeat
MPGLSERVYDVAYSPDGKWIAAASGDPGQFGAVKLWIAEPGGHGKPVRDLLESTDSVFAVAFSPDSKLLAAAGADRAIRIWEVASGALKATIEDHADWIFDLAFSPDGKRLASASRDKTAKVFDVEKKESLVTFPGHAETVYTIGFAPDGKSIATGGGDNQIRIWNPDDDGKQVRALGGFGGAVFRLQYLPDGKSLIACGADKTGARLRPLQRRRPAHAVRARRLGLFVRPLARRQDGRLRELGRRGPPLEPRRRQAPPDDPGRPGIEAGRQRPGVGQVSGDLPFTKDDLTDAGRPPPRTIGDAKVSSGEIVSRDERTRGRPAGDRPQWPVAGCSAGQHTDPRRAGHPCRRLDPPRPGRDVGRPR